MGNKAAAKRRMIEAGVPCVPGYEGADQKDEILIAEGEKIGFHYGESRCRRRGTRHAPCRGG